MRWLAITIFIAIACVVWLPVHVQGTLYGTSSQDPLPVGEITRGLVVSQQVQPDQGATPPAHDAHPHCVGIRFATYMRRNSGRLDVELRQGSIERRWQVRASRLADNRFRYFCPGPAFSAWEPFHLQVSGINGEAGRSATLWLTGDTRLGTLEGQDEALEGMSLELDLVEDRTVGLNETLGVNRGAFLFGWLCTLLIAGVVLLHYPVRANRR